MKNQPHLCKREAEVISALRQRNWSEELRAHVAGCEECAETMTVTAFCLSEAEPETAPDAGLMWRRMELRLKREQAERAMLPAVWAGRAALAAIMLCAVFAAAMLASSSPALIPWLAGIAGGFGLSALSAYWIVSHRQ